LTAGATTNFIARIYQSAAGSNSFVPLGILVVFSAKKFRCNKKNILIDSWINFI
jgi:hypothetical protein